MVSVPHKELLEYKVEKLEYKKREVMQRGSKTNPNFQLVNKPSWICPREVLQQLLMDVVYHLLVKNNKGDGFLLNFFP